MTNVWRSSETFNRFLEHYYKIVMCKTCADNKINICCMCFLTICQNTLYNLRIIHYSFPCIYVAKHRFLLYLYKRYTACCVEGNWICHKMQPSSNYKHTMTYHLQICNLQILHLNWWNRRELHKHFKYICYSCNIIAKNGLMHYVN